jgi:hypothetical protein
MVELRHYSLEMKIESMAKTSKTSELVQKNRLETTTSVNQNVHLLEIVDFSSNVKQQCC